MIPIGKDRAPASFPLVMWLLVVANLGVFLYGLYLGGAADEWVRRWGLVPARLWEVDGADGVGAYVTHAWLPLLTCMFLHGGWLHILGNLLSLRVFGDQIEGRLGHARFLLFYLLCGLLASALHVAVNPWSTVPTIGASGAIAGVMGAYLLLFPFEWISFLVPVFFLPIVIKAPALLYLLAWIAAQVFGGYRTLADGTPVAGGIAFWAHVGGFLSGMYWIRRWRGSSGRPRRPRRR
jgi:membrane associated rhomboid family serine protease